jgi:hypothetical protein
MQKQHEPGAKILARYLKSRKAWLDGRQKAGVSADAPATPRRVPPGISAIAELHLRVGEMVAAMNQQPPAEVAAETIGRLRGQAGMSLEAAEDVVYERFAALGIYVATAADYSSPRKVSDH